MYKIPSYHTYMIVWDAKGGTATLNLCVYSHCTPTLGEPASACNNFSHRISNAFTFQSASSAKLAELSAPEAALMAESGSGSATKKMNSATSKIQPSIHTLAVV